MDEFKNNLLNATYKPGTENTDIQNKLYSWFEKKGLVNKQLAHIREQMICALKDGPAWYANKCNVSSPKTQAINLLVADFLMNQENVFTLSVFITEVPLLGNLHEFSSYVNSLGNSIQTRPVTKPSFQINDVQDILEALGVQPNSDVTELTCQYYFNNDNLVHSLLTCLFKAITTIRNSLKKYDDVQNNKTYINKSTKIEDNTYEHTLNNWFVSIEDTLSSFNLNEVQRNTLKKLFKNYHHNNNSQEVEMYKEKLKKLEKKNKEIVEKVADVEEMLAKHFHSRDFSLLFQKEHIEHATEQLRLEQQQLYQLIHVFEDKEKSIQEKLDKSEEDYNKKLQDVENQKYQLKIKEIEVLRQEKLLKEEPLKHVNETRIIESDQVKKLQEQNVVLAQQLQEIKSKLGELEKHKKKEETSSKKIDNDLQRIETSLDREMVRKLQRENDELREYIKVQKERIEELSIRASSSAKQIEKTHQVSPASINYQTRNVKKILNFVNDSNKTKRCSIQNISSTTTDHSTTVLDSDNLTEDDIIQEARSRLKILEMNSAKVEQKLKHFQKNRMGYTNYEGIRVNNNKRSHNEIMSNLSDDSDIPTLKSTSNKINLKELANRIGYHRSFRRSIDHSTSENDTNPETLHNTKFQNNKNVTNISPIKKYATNILSSNVDRQCSKIKSPLNRLNYYRTEFSTNRPTVSSNENQADTELNVRDNRLLASKHSPDLRDLENKTRSKTMDNIEMSHYINLPKTSNINERLKKNHNIENHVINPHFFNVMKLIDSPKNSTSIQDGSNKDDTSSTSSKKEKEGYQSISYGSNKTDKSSDFWTL